MGCTFTVSLDELRQVGTTLTRTAAELKALADVREGYDSILGNDDVRHEVHAFFQHWSDGLTRIGDHVDELGQHVNMAVEAYEQTEQALITNATPSR